LEALTGYLKPKFSRTCQQRVLRVPSTRPIDQGMRLRYQLALEFFATFGTITGITGVCYSTTCAHDCLCVGRFANVFSCSFEGSFDFFGGRFECFLQLLPHSGKCLSHLIPWRRNTCFRPPLRSNPTAGTEISIFRNFFATFGTIHHRASPASNRKKERFKHLSLHSSLNSYNRTSGKSHGCSTPYTAKEEHTKN